MALTIRPLNQRFVAEVTGLDLRVPPGAALMQAIIEAADIYSVLVFRGQHITAEQHVAFGRLESTIKGYRPGFKGRLDAHVADISNLDENSILLSPTDRRRMNSLGNRLWHTDYTFKETPGMYSLLSARVIPEDGGETQFADLRAAYDALPDRMKQRLEGLVAAHSLLCSRGTLGFTDFTGEEKRRIGSISQQIVRVHPGSRRKTLYLASHAMAIRGMEVPEGRILLKELMDHATRPEFVYTHRWTAGDLVMWDNRCTMHRAREYDETQVRDMHRTTVSDGVPTVREQAAA